MIKDNEKAAVGEGQLLADLLPTLPWNADGLLPAIAQQYDTGEVLMMAWVNEQALLETMKNMRVCYWSRSRQAFWRKGESSGQVQLLKEARLDCDGDTLLFLVDQTGPACHTGRKSCFYNLIDGDKVIVDKEPLMSQEELYGKK